MTSFTRLSVNLIPEAANALDTTAALTGMTQTDTANRALQLYQLLVFETAAGGELWIRQVKRRWWAFRVETWTRFTWSDAPGGES